VELYLYSTYITLGHKQGQLHSFGKLHSVDWQLVTNISGQPKGPIFRGQAIQEGSGFGGPEVACWPLVPKFVGSHPTEAVGFLGRKNPQHTFLWRGSKAVGPMS
jgi:hypothetical protein